MELDPYSQIKALSRQAPAGLPIVIDEIQRLPGLTLALKRIVDEDNRRAHFVLTGCRAALAGAKCLICGEPFKTTRLSARFCSNRCRQRHHRQRASNAAASISR